MAPATGQTHGPHDRPGPALKCAHGVPPDTQTTCSVRTDERLEAVDVTDRVASAVPDDVDAGTCHLFSQHTTAGILVNEDEPRLRTDLESSHETGPDIGHRHDELDGNTVRLAPLA